jgi:hypothetical protein
MKIDRGILAALTIATLVGATPVPVEAGMDTKQVRIAAKVFSYLHEKPQPGASVVVIAGAADVAALTAALGGLKVSEGSVADAANAVAAFVNSTAEADAARRLNPRLLTIGVDVGCIEASACVIAVETTPKVSVYLSRKAAMSANIDFDTSFRMLVTER